MRYKNYIKYNKASWLPDLDFNIILDRPGVSSKHIQDYSHQHDHKHNFDYREITRDKIVNGEVVEMETVRDDYGEERIYKLVVRTELDDTNELVVVIGVNWDYNKLITAWINTKEDRHYTLKLDDVFTGVKPNQIFYY